MSSSVLQQFERGAHKGRVAARFLEKWAGSRIGEALWEPRLSRPGMVCTILTSRCNFRCSFCSHPRMRVVDEIPLQRWKEILRSLKAWLGTFRINFLGGEPLLYPDALELLRFCQRNEIMAGITTNGSLLTESMVRELARCDLFNISISMDSARPELHDELRGVPGSHARILRGLDHLQRHVGGRTRIALRTTVLESNLDDLLPLARMVRQRNLHSIAFQPVESRDFSQAPSSGAPVAMEDDRDERLARLGIEVEQLPDVRDSHWVGDLDRLDTVIGELKRAKAWGWPILNSLDHLDAIRRYYHDADAVFHAGGRCRTAWEQMVILPDGLVRSCTEFPPYGNLHEADPREIWLSEQADRHRRLCARCDRTCMSMFFFRRRLLERAWMFARFY